MKKLLSVVLGGSALLMSAGTHAANSDGEMSANGGTSEGTVVVSATVPLKTRISGLEAVSFAFGNLGDQYTNDGADAVSITQDVAVWSTSRAYSLTASGDATNGFVIANTNADLLSYSVSWKDSLAATAVPLTAGAEKAGLKSNCVSVKCERPDDNKAQLTVSLSAADIEEALVGEYSGVLTLTVQAE